MSTDPWHPKARPGFNRDRRRLSPAVKRALNDAMAAVLQDPFKGDRKHGPLKEMWVEKFKAENDQYLLAYEIRVKDHTVLFAAVGQHENFYRDLRKYLEETRAQGGGGRMRR